MCTCSMFNLPQQVLDENYQMWRMLDFYASRMFSAWQEKGRKCSCWGSLNHYMQTELRVEARRVCRLEEILAVGLINHLGKESFVQGLHNERIETSDHSTGEWILLLQAVELFLKGVIISITDKSGAGGKKARCTNCNRLDHVAIKCMSKDRLPLPTRRQLWFVRSFECGRAGHLGKRMSCSGVKRKHLVHFVDRFTNRSLFHDPKLEMVYNYL